MKRYAVVGKPVRHSRSPWLHSVFARQTQRDLVYAAHQPSGAFADFAAAFFAGGGAGLNITVPYKADALAFADTATAFAARAGAANVLLRRADGALHACNTDGSGLLRDLQTRFGGVAGRRVLLLGAGGAAAAAAHALADAAPAELIIHNRTAARAEQLAAQVTAQSATAARAATTPPAADIIINATSAGHSGGAAAYPPEIFAGAALAYDLSYGAAAADFLRQASAAGAAQTADGIGMLVWQAAFSFALWEGVMPSPAAIINQLTQSP